MAGTVTQVSEGGSGQVTAGSGSQSVDATGSDMIVIMLVMWRNDGNVLGTNGAPTATFDGVSATLVQKSNPNQAGKAAVLYVPAPTQGSATLAFNYNLNGDGLGPDRCVMAYALIKGSRQLNSVDGSGNGDGTGTSFSAALTTAATGSYMYAAVGPQQTAEDPGFATSTNSTGISSGTGTRGAGGFKHSGNPPSTGAQSMNFTMSLSRVYVWAAVAIQPYTYPRRMGLPGFPV
jgi:hypothetical protein